MTWKHNEPFVPIIGSPVVNFIVANNGNYLGYPLIATSTQFNARQKKKKREYRDVTL